VSWALNEHTGIQERFHSGYSTVRAAADVFLDSLGNAITVRNYGIGVGKTAERFGQAGRWRCRYCPLLPRLLKGRTCGPVFVTHRRPGPGKVVTRATSARTPG
jgi:hypothetical protein